MYEVPEVYEPQNSRCDTRRRSRVCAHGVVDFVATESRRAHGSGWEPHQLLPVSDAPVGEIGQTGQVYSLRDGLGDRLSKCAAEPTDD